MSVRVLQWYIRELRSFLQVVKWLCNDSEFVDPSAVPRTESNDMSLVALLEITDFMSLQESLSAAKRGPEGCSVQD